MKKIEEILDGDYIDHDSDLSNESQIINQLTQLFDEEMVKFAEWIDGEYFRLDNGKWILVYGDDHKQITSADMLHLYKSSQ